MVRKFSYYLKYWARRKNLVIVPLILLLLWYAYSSMSPKYEHVEDLMIERYRLHRNLQYMINNSNLLLEPSSTVCDSNSQVPLIALVMSAPENKQERYAVRSTWGLHQPTYFVLGLFQGIVESPGLAEIFLSDNEGEADENDDLIIFDMLDNEQNLTLKTALMINWTLERCPQAKFLLKTEDDVVVNPWTLKKVYKENHSAKLIGYVHRNTTVCRESYMKNFMPRWLYKPDVIPQHLDGAAYMMRVDYLPTLLKTAYEVPLINLEYVYFTYLVAYKKLGIPLRHDWRLNPNKPWLNMTCAYFHLASTHSYLPGDMITTWMMIEGLGRNESDCSVLIPFLLSNNWLLT